MIIRKYGDIPVTYAPDVGEIVEARRSASDAVFVKAAVVGVRRKSKGVLEVKVQWLGDNPAAGTPIVMGTIGWVVVNADGRPELIRQIPKGPPPAAK